MRRGSLSRAAVRFGHTRARRHWRAVDRRGTQRAGLERALLDRLTHHVHILELNGESYHLQASRRKRQGRAEATTDPG